MNGFQSKRGLPHSAVENRRAQCTPRVDAVGRSGAKYLVPGSMLRDMIDGRKRLYRPKSTDKLKNRARCTVHGFWRWSA